MINIISIINILNLQVDFINMLLILMSILIHIVLIEIVISHMDNGMIGKIWMINGYGYMLDMIIELNN